MSQALQAEMQGIFGDGKRAIELIRSPIFKDFVNLVAALSTPDKEDDKDAIKKLLIDANAPEMAALVDPFYDLVVALVGTFGGLKPQVGAPEGFKIAATVEAAAVAEVKTAVKGGLIFRGLVRRNLAKELAAKTGMSVRNAAKLVDKHITDDHIGVAAAAAGFSASQIGDGGLIKNFFQWIYDHKDQILQVISALLPLLLMFI